MQIDFLKRISSSLEREHQAIQEEILNRLLSKLKIADSKLDKLKRPTNEGQESRVKRWRFTSVKEYLDSTIQDLVSWQQEFDPSWYLIMKVADSSIDNELNQHGLGQRASETSARVNANGFRGAIREDVSETRSIFLPEDGLNSARIQDIAYSSAKYVQRTGSDKWLVVDSIPYNPAADINLVTRDVRSLARKLSCGDPYRFSILQCRGVIRVYQPDSKKISSFDFVFNTPEESSDEIKSLRGLLISQPGYSLTERFRLAKQLARSISYIHTLDFVHKNVRPETVLMISYKDSALGPLFLTGFEKMRSAERHTLRVGDDAWEKNIYRHPDRQSIKPEENYIMQHDMYSLGVCLLEIGLWDTLISYPEGGNTPIPSKLLGSSLEGPELKSPSSIKNHLVSIAMSELPKRMGDIYKEIVVDCLTCLDNDNINFGDTSEFEDIDGIKVGVRYIEKVVLLLYLSFMMHYILIPSADTGQAGQCSNVKTLRLLQSPPPEA